MMTISDARIREFLLIIEKYMPDSNETPLINLVEDVAHLIWDGQHVDCDQLVEFNCGLMMYCQETRCYTSSQCVIIFSELSDWAQDYFGGHNERS